MTTARIPHPSHAQNRSSLTDVVPGSTPGAQRGAEGASAERQGERSEPLGNNTDRSSTWFGLRHRKPGKVDKKDPRQRQAARDESRQARWTLRQEMRGVTTSKRVRVCGLPGRREDGSVVLRVTDATGTAAATTTGATGRVAGFSGLWSCGNVWVCPVCSVKIASERAREIEAVMAHFLSRGGWAVLVTLTMRHRRGHSLRQCLTGFSKGWGAVTSGGAWKTHREASDVAGYVRALEVTESPEHGWHVHAHTILVFRTRPSADMIAAITDGMFSRWSAGLVRAGLPAPTREHGIDVQELDLTAPDRLVEGTTAWARYISKGLATEATLGATKEAKGPNRTILQLMRDALLPTVYEDLDGNKVETVDVTARERFAEYEAAIKGRRQLTWSQGLRQEAKLETERTDEEIAADDLDGEDVAVIPRESWRAVQPRAVELLSVTESDGPEAARRWLDSLGIKWYRPTGLTNHHRKSA